MVETLFDAVSKKTLKKKRVISSQSGSGSDTDSASSAGEEDQTMSILRRPTLIYIPDSPKNFKNAAKKVDLNLNLKKLRAL